MFSEDVHCLVVTSPWLQRYKAGASQCCVHLRLSADSSSQTSPFSTDQRKLREKEMEGFKALVFSIIGELQTEQAINDNYTNPFYLEHHQIKDYCSYFYVAHLSWLQPKTTAIRKLLRNNKYSHLQVENLANSSAKLSLRANELEV